MREWRSKNKDLALIQEFSKNLNEFQKLKLAKWEKVDEQVQMSINPGTPSEDWIIPPDENKTFEILNQDPDYVRLRHTIVTLTPEIKKCSKFLQFSSHHDYDWVNFTTPLIGNSALEDAIQKNRQLLKKCEDSCYFWKNITSWFG